MNRCVYCGAMHTSRAPNLLLKIFDVARSESGELSRDGHRPSSVFTFVGLCFTDAALARVQLLRLAVGNIF